MDGARFDRLAAALARRRSRRSAFGLVVGTAISALATRSAGAGTFDRDCDRFVLAAGDDPERKFNNLDDNLLVEVRAKGGGRWRTVWDDRSDDNVNYQGEPFRIPPFRARVGDRLRIQAFNLGGACELDEIWLFCDRSNRGTRLSQGVRIDTTCGTGLFYDETFRIKP